MPKTGQRIGPIQWAGESYHGSFNGKNFKDFSSERTVVLTRLAPGGRPTGEYAILRGFGRR
jgi:hypothetical protein